MACLSYFPSHVVYKDTQCSRENLLDIKQAILEECSGYLKKNHISVNIGTDLSPQYDNSKEDLVQSDQITTRRKSMASNKDKSHGQREFSSDLKEVNGRIHYVGYSQWEKRDKILKMGNQNRALKHIRQKTQILITNEEGSGEYLTQELNQNRSMRGSQMQTFIKRDDLNKTDTNLFRNDMLKQSQPFTPNQNS